MSDLLNIKNSLDDKVDEIKRKKYEKEKGFLMDTIGKDIVNMMKPIMQSMTDSARSNAQDIKEAVSAGVKGIQVKAPTVTVNVPEVHVPEVKVPEARVSVTIPPIKVPDIKWPEGDLPIKGWVNLMGVDLENPLPVQIRDSKGKPIDFSSLGVTTQTGGGWSGGKADFFTIQGFSQSAFSEITNPDGRLKVELPTGSSGLTDTELRASHLDVQQVSGSIDSVNVTGIFGTTTTSGFVNADNRIRVSLETGGSGLTDAELRATALPVSQVSGANWSVLVTEIFGSTSTNLVNPDGRLKVELPTGATGLTDAELRASAVPTIQVSGAADSVSVIATVGLTNTELRAVSLPVEQVSGSNWSTVVTNTVTVTGSLTSTVVTGPTVADAVDDGSAPVQGGGIARTANPTAVAGNDVVKSTHDDLGRQVMRPVQVRDLIATAYVSIATGTETTLLAAVAGAYLDLIYVMGTNNSDAAVTVDLRAVTAGNIATSIRIPANGTAGVSLPVPIPQDETGNNWTADLPDVTGTTVTLSALFSKEV